jgi:hypothetical protein
LGIGGRAEVKNERVRLRLYSLSSLSRRRRSHDRISHPCPFVL